MCDRINVQNNPVNFVDPYGQIAIAPAVYYGGLALSALTGYMIGQYLNDIIDENTDMADTNTWPDPPSDGPFQEGEPSRSKPRKRGEKSLYDDQGGEWRPHKPDPYHPEGHWDHKPPGKNKPWIDVDLNGDTICK